MSPIPVIIDTDAALDDCMAILYLLMNPNVQVLGITTTDVGAAHLHAGTHHQRAQATRARRPAQHPRCDGHERPAPVQ